MNRNVFRGKVFEYCLDSFNIKNRSEIEKGKTKDLSFDINGVEGDIEWSMAMVEKMTEKYKDFLHEPVSPKIKK